MTVSLHVSQVTPTATATRVKIDGKGRGAVYSYPDGTHSLVACLAGSVTHAHIGYAPTLAAGIATIRHQTELPCLLCGCPWHSGAAHGAPWHSPDQP